MKRMSNLLGSLLGLLASAILVIALTTTFLRGESQSASPLFRSPIETPMQSPYPPPATPTVVPTPVPICTFTAHPAPADSGSPLEAYQFSEPGVVLTHTSAIDIIGWLPNGRQLLITRLIAGSKELVNIFDIQTHELKSYGERQGSSIGFNPKPVWLTSERAVAFTDFVDGEVVLRISKGEATPAVEVLRGLANPYIAASPDGRRVIFMPKAVRHQPQILEISSNQKRALALALPWLSSQELSALGQREGPIPYQAAWHPHEEQVVFYNDTGIYLVDLTGLQICEVDLGAHPRGKRWAVDVQWSPDGRYLAVLTTVGDPIVPFIDLTLLDTGDGEIRRLDLGYQYLASFSWAPDGRHLVILAEAKREERANQYDVYIVDAVTGEWRQVLTGYEFMFSGVYGVAWSPTGKEIALACPVVDPSSGTIAEGRLCIIAVEARK